VRAFFHCTGTYTYTKICREYSNLLFDNPIQTEINLPYITAGADGAKHLNMKLTRATLESLVDKYIQRTIEPCKSCLKDAGLSLKDIDNVLLVGGKTFSSSFLFPSLSHCFFLF